MTTNTITLLHTISRVPHTFEENYGRRLLADPDLGKVLKIWDSEKPEVLGQTTVNGEVVDSEGNPVRLTKAEAEKVAAEADAAAKAEAAADKKKD